MAIKLADAPAYPDTVISIAIHNSTEASPPAALSQNFSEIPFFKFQGSPRRVRIWDEAILPELWEKGRGNLVDLLSPPKTYANLTIHHWDHAAGKSAHQDEVKVETLPTEGLADSVASDCPRAASSVDALIQPPTPFDTPVTVPAPTPFQNIMGGLGVQWGKSQSIAAQDAAALEKDRLAKREHWLKLNRTVHWSDQYCDVRTNYLQLMILGRTSEAERSAVANIESQRRICLASARAQNTWDFNSAEVQDVIANHRSTVLPGFVKRDGEATGTQNFFVTWISLLRALEEAAYFQAEQPCQEQAVRAYLAQIPMSASSPIPAEDAVGLQEEPKGTLTNPRPQPSPNSSQSQPVLEPPSVNNGSKVYDSSECIGAVVNDRCHGSVIDTQPMRPHCYGQIINGQCTGPMF